MAHYVLLKNETDDLRRIIFFFGKDGVATRSLTGPMLRQYSSLVVLI